MHPSLAPEISQAFPDSAVHGADRPDSPRSKSMQRDRSPATRRAAVSTAIGVAASMVRNDITRKIGEDLDNFRAHAFNGEAAE